MGKTNWDKLKEEQSRRDEQNPYLHYRRTRMQRGVRQQLIHELCDELVASAEASLRKRMAADLYNDLPPV